MKASSIQTKTIRPGSLNGYSFYYSGRKPMPSPKAKRPTGFKHRKLLAVLVILAIVALPLAASHTWPFNTATGVHNTVSGNQTSNLSPDSQLQNKLSPAATATPASVNECANNSLSQFIKVSISQRHMWACQGSTTVYDSAVVTGISYLAADLTPPGTYHIYAKETDQHLIGHDSTGSWDDYVYYWMPFLSNQYGVYGFHDATWRTASDFGNISPDSPNASHGCVEMPLSAAKWLYDWAQVGTTVTIVS